MTSPNSQPDPSLVERFFTLIPIELCRKQSVCLDTEVTETPQLLVSERTPSFVVDAIRRQLKVSLPSSCIDDRLLRDRIDRAFESFRARSVSSDETSESPDAVSERVVLTADDNSMDLLEDQSESPVIDIVNRILFDAVQQQASDIHFQPNEQSLTVRMRMDGVLFDVRDVPKSMQEEVLTRIKVAGRMDIAEKRLPQDGRATVRVGSRVIDLRIASMPSSHGERIVVRLLDKSARLYQLKELGMDPLSLERFRNAISVEHGLILVTGPTGSGKSTTLYSALQELDTTERNAVTLEDPIEYQLVGVSQTQINLKKGMTFASGLRSVLRQDPDIIMVGEIRDAETAMMAVQAALTGHLVFSTLHTNDAASAVTRMMDLGIEPYLLASSLVSVLAQRLVRRVCMECGGEGVLSGGGSSWCLVPSSLLADERGELVEGGEFRGEGKRPVDGEERGGSIQRSPGGHCRVTSGCKACRNTGYRGRLGIYELLIVDEEIRGLITRRAHSSAIRDEAVKQGMQLLKTSGEIKVAEGVTSREEVERVTMRAKM